MDTQWSGTDQPADGDLPEPVAAEHPAHVEWRVPRGLTALKVGLAVIFLLIALISGGDQLRLLVAMLAVAVLGGYVLRDLLAPVRLAADPEGLTIVAGFAGRRRLPWLDVQRIRVDERRRLGLRAQLLEIDTGDTLHLLSQYDLGAHPAEVADILRSYRTGR